MLFDIMKKNNLANNRIVLHFLRTLQFLKQIIIN